jgi:hypothetical protein
MTGEWLEMNDHRHICHWWQYRDERMITDMTFLILLLVVSVVALATTVRSLFHDGPARPPRSHPVDLDFVAPAARASYDAADRAA